MPLPGGPSGKAGNRYERLWAALVLTDLLQRRCERVRFEVPGPAGSGFGSWIEMVIGDESKTSASPEKAAIATAPPRHEDRRQPEGGLAAYVVLQRQ